MDEIYRILERFFSAAPWPTAAIVIAFMACKFRPWFGGSKKPEVKPEVKKDDYVLKADCHSHIDGLKEESNNRFSEIKEDIREIRDLLFKIQNER